VQRGGKRCYGGGSAFRAVCLRLVAQLPTAIQLIRELSSHSQRGRAGLHWPVQVAVDRTSCRHTARTVGTAKRRLEAHVNAGALSTCGMEGICAGRHLAANARTTTRQPTHGAQQAPPPCRYPAQTTHTHTCHLTISTFHVHTHAHTSKT